MNDIAPLAAVNTAFSTKVPGLQLSWDSTSYDALDKCPRYYKYLIVDGYTGHYINDHLKFGLVMHSAKETYAKARAEGSDHQVALRQTLRHAIFETWDFDLNRPWTSVYPEKTRGTLLRTIVWYLDKFKDDPLKTVILANGKPAVELSFRFDTGLTNSLGEAFWLCGHLDQLAEWNGEDFIIDAKTTKYALDDNYFAQYYPNNQVSVYTIAGTITLSKEIAGLIIDGCQVQVNGSRFRRRQITHSSAILQEWLQDFQIKLHQAESYARGDYWPMNRKACGFGNNQCMFREVCSTEPAMREDVLNSQFKKRTWDPLVPR